jgi:uncharacterized protein
LLKRKKMRDLARLPLDGAAFATKYGPYAVIAGASEGTGSCYAEQLAAMGVNLVLVSRREEALVALGERLRAAHGIEYRAVVQDLSLPGAGVALVEQTSALDVGLYISNAGADGAGNSFLDVEAERSHRLVRMNIGTLIDATHGFGNRFRTRGRGGIIIMASGAGLGGQPMYAGTKAFEICFAESLWGELGDANIDVIAIAAPIMDTPTLRRATEGMGFDMNITYDPADVTHNALASLMDGKPILIVPDGPGQENLPAVEAARIERATAFKEWAKTYSGG